MSDDPFSRCRALGPEFHRNSESKNTTSGRKPRRSGPGAVTLIRCQLYGSKPPAVVQKYGMPRAGGPEACRPSSRSGEAWQQSRLSSTGGLVGGGLDKRIQI